MQLEINSYHKVYPDGGFISGYVHCYSRVRNDEYVPIDITINLSKTGENPKCDIPLRHTQEHNSHAGMFHDEGQMQEYIDRITAEAVVKVDDYNHQYNYHQKLGLTLGINRDLDDFKGEE